VITSYHDISLPRKGEYYPKKEGELMNIVFEKASCFTGHRPKRLPSYNYRHPDNLKMLMKLKTLICKQIEERGISTFISGMALGVDIWSARIILDLKKKKYPHLKLVCAIPCIEQYKKWNEEDIKIYHDVLEQADYVYYVSEEEYTSWCMANRDKWMVDNSRLVIAVWNGDKNSGTGITVDYALKRQRTVLHLDPKTLEPEFLK